MTSEEFVKNFYSERKRIIDSSFDFEQDLRSYVSTKIQSDLDKDKKEIEVDISAFILSVTPFSKVQKVWSDGKVTKDEFAKNNVLFIEKNKEYLSSIFKNLTIADGK